jgi:hypothetical protein
LDDKRHRKVLASCGRRKHSRRTPTSTSTLRAEVDGSQSGRAGAGFAACETWRLTEVALAVPERTPSGEPWDRDGSPPEVVASIFADNRRLAVLPKRTAYTRTDPMPRHTYVHPGERLRVVVTDRDRLYHDSLGGTDGIVSGALHAGVLTMSTNGVTARFSAQCVEKRVR